MDWFQFARQYVNTTANLVEKWLQKVNNNVALNHCGAIVGYVLTGLALCRVSGLLRGKTPNNALAHFTVRSFFYSLFWLPMYFISPLLSSFMLFYAPFYLDLAEHYGSKRYRGLYPHKFKQWCSKYFKTKLVSFAKSPIDGQCVVGIHPHGILPIGGLINLSADPREDVTAPSTPPASDTGGKLETSTVFNSPASSRVVLAATSCFLVPGWRELLLSIGVFDCSRSNAERWLSDGFSVCIVPGGAREGLYANPEIDWLDMRRKRGFISLGLQFGAKLVPTYTFNEVELFSQISYDAIHDSSWLYRIRHMFQKTFGISLPLLSGCWLFASHNINNTRCHGSNGTVSEDKEGTRKGDNATSIHDDHIRLVTVVGDPIRCPLIANPTDADIDEYMDRYCEALGQLYDKASQKYNRRRHRKLQIT